MQGKIIKGIGGFYYVHDGDRTLVECRARGTFRLQELKPLVGDDVRIRLTLEDPGSGYIEELLPRKNTLIRPAVANVDQALIMVSLQRPAFHPALLDRFLLWMAWQQVPVVIGLNKLDMGSARDEGLIRDMYERAGYPVCSFSAKTGMGLPALIERLAGTSTVLAGVSGVGKSTLLNRLHPEAGAETDGLSRKLGRGRHTTRHSEVFCWEKNSFLIDTPGFSSLDLPPLEEAELADLYPEFEAYRDRCRFRDCRHLKEKGCAIREAAEQEAFSRQRYENYCRFMEELKGLKKY